MKKIIIGILCFSIYQSSYAQKGRDILGGLIGGKSFSGQTNKSDTSGKLSDLGFEHRDDAKDSISIFFRYLDSLRISRLDSNINDFYSYFSIPANHQYLGNNGSASYSIVYKPFAKPGWDAGFHAYDIYKYTLENTRFYKTTKPYTQLSYQLASGKEQMIKVTHTQNPAPNFNVGFDYRLISAPGFFVTQNTNHNNYRLFSSYQGKRKRYAAQFVLFGNSIKSSENGGIVNDSLLSNPEYSKRFTIPVNLGGDAAFEPNPFKSSVTTGNTYNDFTFFLRQSYDIGKKDSVEVNDSTTEYLFYPKLRFLYSFTYSTQKYQFQDATINYDLYQNWYDTLIDNSVDTLTVLDKWKIIKNDFSLMQFPDTKNQGQYIQAGVTLENLKGTFSSGSKNFYNIMLHGTYRNKTKNRLWDIVADANFYLNGFNAGDYSAKAELTRYLNKRWGNVRLLFTNVNRTPSFIYDLQSSFNFKNSDTYKKENITTLQANAENSFISLSATNYLITNLVYFTDYRQTTQRSAVINLLQVSASKKIHISNRWKWYADITIQQTDGAAPIKVPLVFTRNRFAFEGVFYKNLNLSTGLEIRYYTPYFANNYSPLMGQFVPQDTDKIYNLPDISAFFHFRIKSFTGFIRAENLNSVSFKNGFGFTNNNFAAPHYAYPGFIFRFGIQWGFVN